MQKEVLLIAPPIRLLHPNHLLFVLGLGAPLNSPLKRPYIDSHNEWMKRFTPLYSIYPILLSITCPLYSLHHLPCPLSQTTFLSPALLLSTIFLFIRLFFHPLLFLHFLLFHHLFAHLGRRVKQESLSRLQSELYTHTFLCLSFINVIFNFLSHCIKDPSET